MDGIVSEFKALWETMDIKYGSFIRQLSILLVNHSIMSELKALWETMDIKYGSFIRAY